MRRSSLILSQVFLLGLTSCIGGTGSPGTGKYTVSIPNLKISDDQVVVSLEIDVTAGAFEAVHEIPVGWYVVIDNDATWQVSLKANTTVGAASLTPDQLKRLRFTIVKKYPPGQLAFEMSGVVSVTKDYEKETPIKLGMKDFVAVDEK